MGIDLSKLEVGDSVSLSETDSITKEKYNSVHYVTKSKKINKHYCISLHNIESELGWGNLFFDERGVCNDFSEKKRITKIIKNPKQWTDNDMKEMFNNGASLANECVSADEWLEQYKVGRNG